MLIMSKINGKIETQRVDLAEFSQQEGQESQFCLCY